MRTRTGRIGRLVMAAALLGGLAACTDEVVYKDTERFTEPPPGAGPFLGFASLETKTTTCGTCHKDRQADWATTKHAVAWEDLQNSGHATGACEGCHTVSNLGNGLTETVLGWAGSKDPRYQNVQCENCHGPGLAHAQTPGLGNLPLASMAASGDPTKTLGCTSCHNGSHHPYAEEWAQSPHALMPFTTEDPAEMKSIVERDASGALRECSGCHTGEWALRKSPTSTAASDVIGFKAGVTRGYKEASREPTANDFQRLTCTVCHDPHKNAPAQLRFPVATADTAQNLCIRCHNRRPASPTSWRGPHSGEGQLVMGLNSGWRPPGFMDPLPAKIAGTHADPGANPKQCATCHMARFDVVDAGGKYVSTAVGHTFNGFPCLNDKGQPTGDNSCTLEQRSFKGCVGSGCHSSETAARNVYVTVEHRVEGLMEELKELLENTAEVPCTEFVYAGKPVNVARGARYNYLLAAGHGHQEADVCSPLSKGEFIRSLPVPVPSHGAVAHNPAYLEQLLRGSIKAVKATYYQ